MLTFVLLLLLLLEGVIVFGLIGGLIAVSPVILVIVIFVGINFLVVKKIIKALKK